MKKTAACILFTVFTALNTQQVSAKHHDDAQKIAVVKGFWIVMPKAFVLMRKLPMRLLNAFSVGRLSPC